MTLFLQQHWLAVVMIAAYILDAMVKALPDTRQEFDFYTWFVHVARSLSNNIPAQYRPK
jgi:hypothetical protein